MGKRIVEMRTRPQATGLVIALEEAAMVALFAQSLGGARPIPPAMARASIKRMAEFEARGVVEAGSAQHQDQGGHHV
ncbi:MAG: hypothetical protein IT307_14490 [Chloroflexi bacterium]|nr:hypothetical protein [Chloroflexota bacterium]